MSYITISRADICDFESYYKHKCESEDIYWNGFTGAPNKDNLYKAFIGRIVDLQVCAGKTIYTLKLEETYIGYIQFTMSEQEVEIGIGIAKDFQGNGNGRKAISLAVSEIEKCFPEKRIFARIRDDNEKSQKCFAKSGFAKTGICSEELFYPHEKPIILRKYILTR